MTTLTLAEIANLQKRASNWKPKFRGPITVPIYGESSYKEVTVILKSDGWEIQNVNILLT